MYGCGSRTTVGNNKLMSSLRCVGVRQRGGPRRNRGPTFTPPRSCEKKVLKKQGPTPHVTLCCNRRITHVHAQHNTTKTRSQRDTYSSFRPGRWIAPIDRIETPTIAFHCTSHTTYTLLVARLHTRRRRLSGARLQCAPRARTSDQQEPARSFRKSQHDTSGSCSYP